MKLRTLFSPLNVEELFFTNKTTIVIDVLRATSTIVTALNNGAKEIIPVGSIEFAVKASGSTFSSHTLLAGERNTKKIDGFALGNSPLEFTNEIVNGKSIVLFTTNGSKAIVKAKYSSQLFVSSFLNSISVAKHINNLGDDEIIIVCSGNNGLFSFEDSVCAGDLINELSLLNEKVKLDDASKTCHLLFQKNKNRLTKMLYETEHGLKLIEQGFKEDIEYISQKDIIDIIPKFEKGSIKSV